jgi:transcriptional regulator with XRE-family HTH domain
MSPGELLRGRREAHGVSQRALALRAGTRQATISRIENGREIPTVDRLHQLLLALGERLDLDAAPLDPERPRADVRRDHAKGIATRLEEGFALAAFASDLAGAARR